MPVQFGSSKPSSEKAIAELGERGLRSSAHAKSAALYKTQERLPAELQDSKSPGNLQRIFFHCSLCHVFLSAQHSSVFVLAKPTPLPSTAPSSNPSAGDTVLPQIFNQGIKLFSWQKVRGAPRVRLSPGARALRGGLLRGKRSAPGYEKLSAVLFNCFFWLIFLLTGSRPSIASIHSLRSSSESACMVITPGLWR